MTLAWLGMPAYGDWVTTKVPPAGVYVPGELLLAGPAVTARGSEAAFYVWCEKPEEPYYFSERGTSGDGRSALNWQVESEDGKVLKQGKLPLAPRSWKKLEINAAGWKPGRYRVSATLLFSGTPFSRVMRDVVARGKADALLDVAWESEGSGVKAVMPASAEAARVALYGTFRVPVPEIKILQGGETVATVAAFSDERFEEKELFLGYLEQSNAADQAVTVEPIGEGSVAAVAFRAVVVEGAVRKQPGGDQEGRMRLVMNNDGLSEGFFDPAWNVDRLPEQVYRYRGTEVSQLDWTAFASGVVSFKSRFADFYGEGFQGKWPNERENLAVVRALTELEGRELKLYPWLVALGKETGISVWGSLRMSAYYGEHPFGAVMNGRLWREHPEMRIKGSKGERAHFGDNMSFAYEEVRAQRIGVLTELVEAGCDGVNLDFCRYPGVLGYEAPMLEQFRKKHGRDGRTITLDDPRWVSLRQKVINEFMRKVREAMNEAGERRGRDVKVSVRLPANRYETFGFDPQTWIREGWVDCIIPAFPGRDRWFDVGEWNEMRKGTGVELLAGTEHALYKVSENELTDEEKARGIKPGYQFRLTRDDYLRRAAEVYEKGADGMYLFNAWSLTDLVKGVADREYVTSWRRYQDAMNLASKPKR